MAQMIPEFYSNDTPPGEKLFFDWLAKECPSDWVVFHSLDLQAWNRSRRTEMDFLVVIPSTGILCVEIKSHEQVEVRDGSWFLNNKVQEKPPLRQIEDAQKTLYRRLKEYIPRLSRIPMARLVAFPRAIVSFSRSIEFNPWEVWNQDNCVNSVADQCFSERLEESLSQSIDHTSYLQPLTDAVSERDIEALREFARPTFKSLPADEAQALERKVRMDKYLREQQRSVLRQFRDNQRLILDGPAGTGKSLVALEIARRLSDEGKRTALFCFNRPMAKFLEEQTKDDGPRLVAGGIHACLARLLEIDIPDDADSGYWAESFVDLVESRMLDDERKFDCSFDVLVVDEAQDFFVRPRLLELVEMLLEGGFASGRWLLAGDFRYQVFADDEKRDRAAELLEELRDIPRTTYSTVDENCRNYRIIGHPATRLAGMVQDNVYSGFMRGDGTHKSWNPIFFEHQDHEVGKLETELRRLLDAGTKPGDIAILSFATHNKSVAAKLNSADILLKRIGTTGDRIGYGSIHEFKGLEANVIVLTDIRQPENDFDRDLFYVALTRAIFSVTILVPSKLQRWFMKALGATS